MPTCNTIALPSHRPSTLCDAACARYSALSHHLEAFRVFSRIPREQQLDILSNATLLFFFGTNDGGPTRLVRWEASSAMDMRALHQELTNNGHSRLLVYAWEPNGDYWRKFEIFRQH